MIRCHECKETKPKGRMVTYRTRERTYYATDRYGNVLPIVEGKGFEIVEEHLICEQCILSIMGDGEIEADLAQARETFLDVMAGTVQ